MRVYPFCGAASSTNREPLPPTTAGLGKTPRASTGAALGGALTVTGSLGLLADLLVAPLFADVVTEGEFKEGKLRKAEAAEEGKAEPAQEEEGKGLIGPTC